MAVLLAGCVAVGVASAQTPASITMVSGNGQLICYGCIGNPQSSYQAMTVQVLDSTGKPVPAGTTVTWTVTSGDFVGQLSVQQSVTDQNGMSSNYFFPGLSQSINAFHPYIQTTIAATAGSASATFTETEAFFTALGVGSLPPVNVIDTSAISGDPYGPEQPLTLGTTISGQVGTTWNPPFKVLVQDSSGSGIPNVAINLYSLQPASSGPTVQCGGPNAVNGTVFTDATGLAVCSPVFGGTPGAGDFYFMIGGIQSNAGDPNNIPQAFKSYTGLHINVTPGVATAFNLVSGNSQSAQAGTTLANSLVVQVLGSGSSPLAGQTVTWTVSPAGAATLANTSTATDANGKATNTLTFGSSASGSVQVTAKLSGSSLPALTFTETAVPNVTITGLSIVSGDKQAAIVSTQFAAPLVIQLNASNGTASGIPVQFSVSGPATISSSTVNTGSNGQAQVTATAGATAGAVTVTATYQSFSATFNLTVSPPGPTLTAAGFVNGADLQRSTISPCGLATIIATGIAPGVQNTILPATSIGPFPTTLGGTQVSFGGIAAPIVSLGLNAIGQQTVTFQVPCETAPNSGVPVAVNVGAGNASIAVPVQAAAPGVFTTLLSDNNTHAVVVRPDGSFVTIQNPARRGETVVAFATGLGPSSPAVATGALPPPGITAIPQYQVVVGMAGRGVPLMSAQLSPDRVGVWIVTFSIPADITAGNSVSFSISVIPTGSSTPISSGTSSIPVQ